MTRTNHSTDVHLYYRRHFWLENRRDVLKTVINRIADYCQQSATWGNIGQHCNTVQVGYFMQHAQIKMKLLCTWLEPSGASGGNCGWCCWLLSRDDILPDARAPYAVCPEAVSEAILTVPSSACAQAPMSFDLQLVLLSLRAVFLLMNESA